MNIIYQNAFFDSKVHFFFFLSLKEVKTSSWTPKRIVPESLHLTEKSDLLEPRPPRLCSARAKPKMDRDLTKVTPQVVS